MRVYFDTTNIIYLVEQVVPYAASIRARLSVPGAKIVLSDLTWMECLVKPLRTGNAILLAEYHLAFSKAEVIHMVPAVFDKAAEIRASFNFKTPDSLHLAAAVIHGCDVFYTHDHRLGKYTGITVEVL
ncbi:MAG: type II toxin-antitoxin system VapC family toxin [Zavarzinella sp.]|nr:type II toxin-antitoxin system VapC family toxin [Zavarzinella sp.]